MTVSMPLEGHLESPVRDRPVKQTVKTKSCEDTHQREFVKFGKPKKYYWTVYYYLAKRPEKGEPINLDLELKFAENEEYFYLLKGAELDIK